MVSLSSDNDRTEMTSLLVRIIKIKSAINYILHQDREFSSLDCSHGYLKRYVFGVRRGKYLEEGKGERKCEMNVIPCLTGVHPES